MLYTKITEFELDQLLDRQFNPPRLSDSFTKDDFYLEWKNVQTRIKAILEKLGYKSWNDGGDDYTMPDDWGYSRHHEIEIHKRTMLEGRVIPELRKLLFELGEDYEIVVSHDLFLRDDVEPFHVVVRKNCVLASAEDEEGLQYLSLHLE